MFKLIGRNEGAPCLILCETLSRGNQLKCHGNGRKLAICWVCGRDTNIKTQDGQVFWQKVTETRIYGCCCRENLATPT